MEEHTRVAPTCELDVVDRVCGGAGFFYGLLTGESAEDALKLGWAHGALLTTYPGDTTMATLEQVRALAGGASARIRACSISSLRLVFPSPTRERGFA